MAKARAEPTGNTEPPRQLSEEAIVDAAQELTRRVGFERLTMRALADALGVSPMATYHYVKGRDQVLLLVVDRVLAAVEVPPACDDDTWDDRLWNYMQSMREAIAGHPGITDFLLTHEVTDAAQRYMETCIGILEEGGFSPEDARSAFMIIYTFMWGGSVFLGVQNLRKSPGKGKRRRGPVPSVDELASVEAAEVGYRTIVAGLERRRHVGARVTSSPAPVASTIERP